MAADALGPFVTPHPPALPLFTTGLGVLGLRKRGLIAMARNEARRIAINIAKLQELLQR